MDTVKTNDTERTNPVYTGGNRTSSGRACVVILAVASMMWGGITTPLRINWTGSAPLGLYATSWRAPTASTDLAIICLQGGLAVSGRALGYLPAGSCSSGTSPILKQVVAVAGDEVELRSDAIVVNGRVIDRSQRLVLDSLGRALKLYPLGRHIVLEGEVWVLGVHRERSWDSRYFGPIPVSSIVGVARPLLTLSLGKAR